MDHDSTITRDRLTTPRAAAVAGILFSVLLITSLVLIRISVPARPAGCRGTGLRIARRPSAWPSTWCRLQVLPSCGSSAWCATAWGHMKIVSSPPCSWAVGSCFWPCSLLLQR